jgi:hypothetical protein
MPQQGRSHLLRPTRNPRLRLSRINATPRHLNKMVHKSHFHKTASVTVVIVAMEAQVFVVRHLAAAVGRLACSSRPVAAGMGTYLKFRSPHHSKAFNSLQG